MGRAWVCPDNPFVALLERLPVGHRMVEEGSWDFAAATAAAREVERLSILLGDESNPRWSEIWQESLDARARSSLLAIGRFEDRNQLAGIFRTTDGDAIRVNRSVLRPPAGSPLWAVFTAPKKPLPNDADVSLRYFCPYEGPVLLPDYGDGVAANLLRSRVIERLLPAFDWPGQTQATVDGMRDVLRRVHCPADAQTAEPVYDPVASASLADLLRDASTEEYRHQRPEAARGLLPPPRLIKTHREAEEYAAEVLWALGFTDAEPTPPGADGGVDVLGSGVVAQVKMEGVPTGRPVLQAIAGIASVEGARALVFSLAGYTPQALDWAERAHVACFEFAFDGVVEPRSSAATELLTTVTLRP